MSTPIKPSNPRNLAITQVINNLNRQALKMAKDIRSKKHEKTKQMSDASEMWRDWNAATKEKRATQLAESDTTGFIKHTNYHFSQDVAGHRLDWWPSTRRWQYKQHIYYGTADALHGFIRNKIKQTPPEPEAKAKDGCIANTASAHQKR